MRIALLPILAMLIGIMPGCSKKKATNIGSVYPDISQYTAKMSRARLWSGNYKNARPSSIPPTYVADTAWQITDSGYTVQVMKNDTIEFSFSQTKLYFSGMDSVNKILTFKYDPPYYEETSAQLRYFVQNDSMAYTYRWDHHGFYSYLDVHTN